MNREDVRKLLGGYATGTLSASEREALFSAALDDQELFDSLMKEEVLREVLEEPGAKAQLLAALEKPAAQPAWWSWRPLIGAVAMAGIALTAVAIWRTNREKPAPVITAEVAKQTPPPALVLPPVVIQPAAPAQTRSRTESKVVRDERRQEKEKDNAAVADVVVPSEKAESQGGAAAAAPPPPAAPRQQQAGQFAAPSPMVQQQAIQSTPSKETVTVEAAAELNRAAAVSGFRAAAVKEASSDLLMTKKVLGPLQWVILRGNREVPPGAMLGAGESVRLRIYAQQSGTLTLTEADKVLVSAEVEPTKPFDTPAIPFTTGGPRQFRLSLATGAPQPEILTITLNYAR